MGKLKEIEEEFDNLMQAGYDELAVGDTEIAEEYFSDAGSIIYNLPDKDKEYLAGKYSVNPLDFAR